MASSQTQAGSQPPRVPTPLRQPWWVPAVAVFGALSFFGGLTLLVIGHSANALSRDTTTGFSLVIAGIVLIPIAWMKRVRRPSHSAAEERAQEADNQPIPPNEA